MGTQGELDNELLILPCFCFTYRYQRPASAEYTPSYSLLWVARSWKVQEAINFDCPGSPGDIHRPPQGTRRLSFDLVLSSPSVHALFLSSSMPIRTTAAFSEHTPVLGLQFRVSRRIIAAYFPDQHCYHISSWAFDSPMTARIKIEGHRSCSGSHQRASSLRG